MMRARASTIAIGCMFFLMLCLRWAYGEESGARISPFKLVSQDLNTWTVEYTQHSIPFSTVALDGQIHMVFSGGMDDVGTTEGSPLLPAEVLSLGIPLNAAVAVDVTDPIFEYSQNQSVAPSPSYRYTEDNSAIAEYRKDARAYAQDRFFPSNMVKIDAPFVMRQQRINTIRLFPLQYNPVTKTLKRLKRATLHIHLIGPVDKTGLNERPSMALPEPHFEEVYKRLLWNYDQAKQWRQSRLAAGVLVSDPSRDWFDVGPTYYRIPVAADGWYRVTKADLSNAGANLTQIDITKLKVFGRGVEIPVLMRPDTTVEFYGVMNHGDSTYFDYWTDTNAYWLTWGGIAGLRFHSTPQTNGSWSDIRSAITTRHFEQNTAYYRGATQTEINLPGPVPGKGWIWEYYFPNSTLAHTFVLDAIDTQQTQSTLRIWLFGTTSNSPPVSHKAMFWMNDSLVGEISFGQRTGALFNAEFPTAWLKNGTNTLTIKSVDTGTSPNGFYLDWFEIDYVRYLRATGNQLVFTSPPSSGALSAKFTVSGFSNPQIDVIDINGKRRIDGGVVTGDSTQGYSVAFQDTFSSARAYVVVCSSGQLAVPKLTQKVFSDLRSNGEGADYIIITHKDFLPAAQRLAAHRRTVNGVRTNVVTTQDIYDEFNYGIFSGETLKAFLGYAYQHWPPPAPTYLLLFGDAAYDDHHYFTYTTKRNFVPSYGVPTSDNWFGCFDTLNPYLPSLLIGRISVEDSIQADRLVSKVTDYDTYLLGEWNKNFLAITGGDQTDQFIMNDLSERMINTYFSPPPFGGTVFRVYKSSPDFVDYAHKDELRNLVKKGMVFINYLGHAAGQIWAMDIGDPNDLENTNGMLPFVSSVSCNIGGFGDQAITTGAELWTRADHRGAIALWGAVSLGFANLGSSMTSYFLASAQQDSIRSFGSLTTISRIKLWQEYGPSTTVISTVQLTPLVGDPLSRLAIPLKPDLALSSQDMSLNYPIANRSDSSLTLRIDLHNHGLVPGDSVGVTVTDLVDGLSTAVLNNKKLPPLRHHDSLFVSLDAVSRVGLHTLTVSLDPIGVIAEVNESNNVASKDEYVYANSLAVVKPINGIVVQPGPQSLLATSPAGLDSAGFNYYFQLDTVDTFDSPFLVQSPSIPPEVAGARWTTPSLIGNQVYFWRVRTTNGPLVGNWVTSSFSVASSVPSLPSVRWRQYTKRQFARDRLEQSMATDSGATMAVTPTFRLYSRSVGERYSHSPEYYSVIGANDETFSGYWWNVGRSFIALRLNAQTGLSEFRGFDIAGQAAQADSMKTFIQNTPDGNYIAVSVVLDGRTNINESLYGVIESLGSTRIRQLLPGYAWAFIGRKGTSGPGMTPLESMSPNGVTAESLQVPTYFMIGNGSVTTEPISIAESWGSFHWRRSTSSAGTDARVALLGVRADGVVETLRVLPKDSTDVDLAWLTTLTSGPKYTSFKASALVSNNDGLVTPVLREWWLDFEPPADLAISSRSVGPSKMTIQQGTTLNLPITIYNVGYRDADSARVLVSMYDKYNRARPIASGTVGQIPIDGFQTVSIPISPTNFPRRVTLQIAVSPSKKRKDLVQDNNIAYYTFAVTGIQIPEVQVFADGVQLMNGDYVSSRPKILVRLPKSDDQGMALQHVDFYVDRNSVISTADQLVGLKQLEKTARTDEFEVTPVLSNGRHDLTVRLAQVNSYGDADTLEHTVAVNVMSEARILQCYNYPNPFPRDTYFTFVITGERAPEELRIRIFTVAGRKIQEILVPQSGLQIGFNRIYWDGRDTDGDEVANGYYLYQVSMTSQGKTESRIEKLAKVR